MWDAGLDSWDLFPLMQSDGPVAGRSDESVSQFAGKELMIKRTGLKYQLYDNAPAPSMREVLFDLNADPAETANRINEPGYAEQLEMFRRRAAELGFGDHADARYVNARYTT